MTAANTTARQAGLRDAADFIAGKADDYANAYATSLRTQQAARATLKQRIAFGVNLLGGRLVMHAAFREISGPIYETILSNETRVVQIVTVRYQPCCLPIPKSAGPQNKPGRYGTPRFSIQAEVFVGIGDFSADCQGSISFRYGITERFWPFVLASLRIRKCIEHPVRQMPNVAKARSNLIEIVGQVLRAHIPEPLILPKSLLEKIRRSYQSKGLSAFLIHLLSPEQYRRGRC